jgi:hypothetical protein
VSKAARGRWLADKPPASKWLYIQNVLIKVVYITPSLVLSVPVVYSSDVANVYNKAAKVTCFIDLVKDKFLV